MPTKLHIFDFDSTLFKSPEKEAGIKKYEKLTGIPWIVDKESSRVLSKKFGQHVPIRKGYWGRPESLQPPLVPDPAPADWFISEVCQALKKSKADENTMTTILTGRHAGLKKEVFRICDQGKLVEIQKRQSKSGETFYDLADANVAVHLLGEDGPKPKGNKPTETLPWKLWIIDQYLEIYPDINEIEFWEDRIEHVEHFRSLHGALVEKVTVNHIVAD